MNDDGTDLEIFQQCRDLVFGDWTSAAIFVPRRVWIGERLMHHLLRCYLRAVLGKHRPQGCKQSHSRAGLIWNARKVNRRPTGLLEPTHHQRATQFATAVSNWHSADWSVLAIFEAKVTADLVSGLAMGPSEASKVARCAAADWNVPDDWKRKVVEAIERSANVSRVFLLVARVDEGCDVRPAGELAKGYSSLNFSGVGQNFSAIQDILKYVVDKGKSQVASRDKVGENLYNRGVMNAVLITEAIRAAQRLTDKKQVSGEDVRRGLETLSITNARWKELGLPDFAAPIHLSCSDHNGHHGIYLVEWDGTKWTKASGWIEPIKEKVLPLIESAASNYVGANTGWPKRTEACDKSS